MASDSEDLEFNRFYQTLQSPAFLPIYEQAQQKCWLVCIPQATSLQGCVINKQFMEMHLLEPSVMYRDRYHSFVRGQKVTWHMQGNVIESLSESGSIKATVLTEELAYNKSLQQFKIFILDRPLDPEYKPSSASSKIQDSLRVRRTFREQRELLLSFHNCRKPITDLDSKIRSFIKNYMIVETESLLQDTASKLRAMAKQAAMSFLEANSRDERMADRRVREAVWLAVEGYLLCSVHSKVYPAICGLHKKQEATFITRCKHLKGKLTARFVGLPDDFQCEYHKTLKELTKMDTIQSPLDGLYTFQNALDNIMLDVRDHFTKSLRMGEPPPLASDDLIALLASIIVQVKCSHLLSSVYYMEYFHWSLSDADKLSFSLVTLRAAVEYIRGPEVEKLLPKVETTQKRVHTSSQVPPKLYEDRRVFSSGGDTGDPWASLSSISAGSLFSSAEESRDRVGGYKQSNENAVPPRRESRKEEKKKKQELGPFLSLLMNSETVSSSDFCSDR